MACEIAARVPLIVAKRLAERDVFTRHDEEMINVFEEYKRKSRKIICIEKKLEIYAMTAHYDLFCINSIFALYYTCNYLIASLYLSDKRTVK